MFLPLRRCAKLVVTTAITIFIVAMSSSQISPAERCTPVPSMPGLVDCAELRKYDLAVASDWGVVCCTRCDITSRVIGFNKVRSHVKAHFQSVGARLTSTETNAFFTDLCRKYRVREQTLNFIPVPAPRGPSLPFLKPEKVYKCLLCEDDRKLHFMVSDSSRRDHFRDEHGFRRGETDRPEVLVDAQTFCSGTHNPKTWFEVNLALDLLRGETDAAMDEDQLGAAPITPEDLAQAYLSEYTPVGEPNVNSEDLHDVAPFLHASGWVKHVGQRDVAKLRALVATPEENDPLRHLYNTAVLLFSDNQKEIPNQNHIQRWNLMDEEAGLPKKELSQLDTGTAADYGRVWGRWVVFICRLRRMALAGDTFYPIHFTDEQARWADNAIDYCYPARRVGEAKRSRPIFYSLADFFWRQQPTNQFGAMATDEFSDPTVRFACLMNLYPDGSFATPRNACHNIVRIKYIIRSALYNWSLIYHQKHKLGADSVIPFIAGAVSKRKICPFSSISYLVSQATMYANTSVHLPNVVWTSNSILVVEGRVVDFNVYRQRLHQTIERLELLIKNELMLGLDASEFGFNITETTPIVDKLHNSAPGYSMFEERENGFNDMVHALAMRFFTHRGADDLIDRAQSTPERVAYKGAGLRRFLQAYETATRDLALCMHMMGGQPGRGTEFVDLAFCNSQHRVRNIYMIGPGRMVYVLFYNKTTSQTGFDRVVAHAIPWRLGRLVLLMRSLISPFVAHVSRGNLTEQQRAIQLHYVFAIRGVVMKSEQLSDAIAAWFVHNHQVSVRLRVLRQFIIAVQRKFMAAAFDTIKRVLNAVDAQAGHSTIMAREHYAIEQQETHLLNHDSIRKYIAVSMWWWRVLFHDYPDMLTEIERGVVSDAPQEFAQAPNNAGTLIAQKDAIRGALSEFLEQGALGKEIALYLWQKMRDIEHSEFTHGGRSVAPGTYHYVPGPRATYTSQPAEFVDPQAAYVRLLKLYCKDPAATWTSVAQGQALAHILSRQHSLLVVLPTGGGKSFLFAAMQYYERGVTVVVFPLRALMLDQMAAALKRDPNNAWVPWHRDLNLRKGIVVTGVESLPHPDFAQWCAALNEQRILSRIVIDECHLVPSSVDFRVCMNNLKPLVEAQVPLVNLSATMPPEWEPDLNECIGYPSWRIIRTGTQRPNLRLRTACYGSRDDALDGLKALLDHYLPTLSPTQGVLIVVRTKDDADQLSRILGYPSYHSEKSNEDRDKIAADWIAAKFKVVIGTTALGTGVHHPGCVLVIHWQAPWGLLSYAQEIGRAGRAGQPALCVIIHWMPHPLMFGRDYKGYQALLNMLEDESGCMRLYLSIFLDGTALQESCFSGRGNALCGRCEVQNTRSANRNESIIPELLNKKPGPRILRAGHLPHFLIELGQPGATAGINAPAAHPAPQHVHEELPVFEGGVEGENLEGAVGGENPESGYVTPDTGTDAFNTDTEDEPVRRLGELSVQDAAAEGPGTSRAASVQHNPDIEMQDSWIAPGSYAGATRAPAGPSVNAVAGPSRITARNIDTPGSGASSSARQPAASSNMTMNALAEHSARALSFSDVVRQTAPGPDFAALPQATRPVSPNVPLFQRNRAHPTSPTRRRAPSGVVPISPTHTRPQPPARNLTQHAPVIQRANSRQPGAPGPSTQALNAAANDLVPMNPTGVAVLQDAFRSIERRSNPVDPFQDVEEQAGLFRFDFLLGMKGHVGTWCFYCLVHGGDDDIDHNIRDCTAPGAPSNDYQLEKINGQTFTAVRTWLRRTSKLLPSDGTLCKYCFWPYHVLHGHPTPREPGAVGHCTANDFLLPMCWTLIGHDERRNKMVEFFRQTNEDRNMASVRTPEEWMKWLFTVRRLLTWNGQRGAFYNVHAVLMWIVVQEMGMGPGTRTGPAA
ncbi:hypothetical protein FRC08_009029 [Ceratobasidium sp. 394]|nr:hypothetical protein FRC08_009029 [Ceratobasidium sp. 394]